MSELPISVPPSEQYGQAAGLEEAQQQVPMGAGPLGAIDPTAAPSEPGPEGPLAEPGQGFAEPGMLGEFDGPTEFPDEPITSGIDLGEGPGSEVLTSTPRRNGADLLIRVADETQDPVLLALAEKLERRR